MQERNAAYSLYTTPSEFARFIGILLHPPEAPTYLRADQVGQMLTMKRDSLIAGLLSLLVPGLGQAYCGASTRGAAILVSAIVVSNLNLIILPVLLMADRASASKENRRWNIPRTRSSRPCRITMHGRGTCSPR
jgi:hypothetical protein